MSRSIHILYAHIVISTAYRYPYLSGDVRNACHGHLNDILRELMVYPIAIDGLPDHVHLLIKYKSSSPLADIVKTIKGKSGYLLNRSLSTPITFRWSKGYFVASVSPGDVPRIQSYILDQEKTHQAEYQAWVARHFGPPDETGSV